MPENERCTYLAIEGIFDYVFSQEDLYSPHPLVQDTLWGFLHHFAEPVLKRWPFSKLRDKALGIAIKHGRYEDENTRYLCNGSIDKVTTLYSCYVRKGMCGAGLDY